MSGGLSQFEYNFYKAVMKCHNCFFIAKEVENNVIYCIMESRDMAKYIILVYTLLILWNNLLCWALYLEERGIFMEPQWIGAVATVAAALIAATAALILDIRANIKTTKTIESLIGKSKTGKNLIAMLGSDEANRISLSDDHQAIIQTQTKLMEDVSQVKFNLCDQFGRSVECLSALQSKEYNIGKAVGLMADQWADQIKKIKELEKETFILKENIVQLQSELKKKDVELVSKDEVIEVLRQNNESLTDKVQELKDIIEDYENPTPPTIGLGR